MVSGVALLVPAVALFGALALAATMVGAILTHVFVIGGSPALPMILLMATSFIAWTRWSGR
jgi:putative oxidoreductase